MREKDAFKFDPALRRVIHARHRSEDSQMRDRFRHPFETLNFFDVAATDTVVDLWPGSTGWWTEILAPYLKSKGRYIAAGYDPKTETSFAAEASQSKFEEKLRADPVNYGEVVPGKLSPTVFEFGNLNSADKVLAFRVHHIFMANEYLSDLTRAVFNVLKPGGILGIVEHREDPARPYDRHSRRGYVNEERLIGFHERMGFQLIEKSEINSNPRDTKDHPDAVWSLPPWMVGVSEADRQKYLKIGESDRMTLKFVKSGGSNGA